MAIPLRGNEFGLGDSQIPSAIGYAFAAAYGFVIGIVGPLVMGWVIDFANVSAGLVMNSILIAMVAIAFWLFAPNMQAEKHNVEVLA
jgi:sugar phosphate permease